MKLTTHNLTHSLFCLCSALLSALILPAQNDAVSALDNYFNAVSANPQSTQTMFMDEGRVTSVTYNAQGEPTANVLKVSDFLADLASVQTSFDIKLEPVVLVAREHSHSASIYCSVYGRFAANDGGDSVLVRSMQSFKMVLFEGSWKISGITIQNEAPSSALPAEFWPGDLTEQLFNGSKRSFKADKAYDPSKIYVVGEVDERPVYPGKPEELKKFLATYGASEKDADSKTPFTIMIDEAGEARLDYVSDLSGAQIEQAKKMVADMIPWYPAIVDKASVKCRKVLYISE